MLPIGSEIAGYRVERVLGFGGMGTVYLVQNPTMPRRDALKVLSAEFSGGTELRARFLREDDVESRLEHPNIVSIYRRGLTEDGHLWIAMQFVDGINADTALQAGTMTPERAIAIVTESAKALDYAHRHHVIHRDVKPSNLLLFGQGGIERVLLSDFGIARALDDSEQTETASLVATVAYAAPEVLSGMPFDHRADVYSLGCTLFRLLTGKPPFFAAGGAAEVAKAHLEQPPPPVTAHMPGLPPALDPVIARALAKDPSRRFQSAGEFAAAAAAAMRDHTRDSAAAANATPGAYFATSADPTLRSGTVPARLSPLGGYVPAGPPRPRRWNRRLIAVVSAVVVLLAGGITAVVIAAEPEKHPPAAAQSSEHPVPPVPPVSVAALAGLLLGPDEISAIMGAQLEPKPVVNGVDNTVDLIVEKDCAEPVEPVQKNAYAGSGWLKAVQQPLVEAKGLQVQDNWWILFPRRVVEAVVNFVSADKAADFLTKQKGVWAQCANHAINFKADNPDDKPIDLGDFKIMPDGTLTMTVSEEGAMGDTCARALAVRNNVAIDLHACSRDNPMEQALAMVKKIAAKIPQR
jgi:eukaryotic-like serine/threonine-protein kinase